MRKQIRDYLHRYAEYIEIVLAVVIALVILICVAQMIYRIALNPLEIHDEESFHTFLTSALSLIVGIEFLKMIIIPTSQNIIETLLFAVARQIILDHSPTVLVVGMLSVTILFIIKKFLITEFIEKENIRFSGATLVTKVNSLADCDLPIIKDYNTIGELLKLKLNEENKKVQHYSTVKFGNTVLTAIKVKDGSIKKVEVSTIESKEEEL